MRYTFWHGGVSKLDLTWLDEAEEELRRNTWTSPVYMDGTGWNRSALRPHAARRLLLALQTNASAPSLTIQNATLTTPLALTFATTMARNQHLQSVTLRNLCVVVPPENHDTTDNNDEPSNPYGGQDEEEQQADHLGRQGPPQQRTQALSVPSAVFCNPRLESIHLAKVSLSVPACQALSRLITSPTSALNSITLQHVHFEAHSALISLLAATVVSRSLTRLVLSHVTLTPQERRQFLMATSLNRSLTTLHLERMDLNATDDAPAVAQLLQRNQTLVELSLRHNQLDSTALQLLVDQGLLANTTLQRLFLSRNPLANSGPSLARLVQRQQTLDTLCLVDTRLTHADCRAVLQAVPYNTGLRALLMDGTEQWILEDNGGTTNGCGNVLLQALQHSNTTLTRILDRVQPLLVSSKQKGTATATTAAKSLQLWKQVDFYLRANQAPRTHLQALLEQPPLHRQQDVLPYWLEQVHQRPGGASIAFLLWTTSVHRLVVPTATTTTSTSTTRQRQDIATTSPSPSVAARSSAPLVPTGKQTTTTTTRKKNGPRQCCPPCA